MTNHEHLITNLRVKLYIIEAALEIVAEQKGCDYNGSECMWGLGCVISDLRDRLAMATDHDADYYLDPGTKLPSGEIV